MTSPRVAGGPGRGRFRQTWQGATVLQQWLGQVQDGLAAEAAELLADLRASIHVESGEMRDKAFAEVEVRGTKRTLTAGSAAEHAAYEELGTSRRPAHPVIREVMDRHQSHITQKIAAARKGSR